MSDTQAAMREFRFLDDKRKTNGLTPQEEQRWYELAGQLGVDMSQYGQWGADGQWYPYPPGYDPSQQWAQQGGYYDPNQPQQPYYGQPGYYDPNQPQQGWDPAQQQAWDQNQQAWDPQQPQQPQDPQQQAAQPDQQQAWGQPPQQQWPGYYDQSQAPPQYPPGYGQQGWYGQPGYYDPNAPPPPGYYPPQAPAYQGQWQQPPPQPGPQPGWAPPPAQPVPAWQPSPEPPVAGPPPEVSSDDVMEISDDEVSPIPTAPPPTRSAPERLELKVSDDPVADLRSALLDDEPATDVAPLRSAVAPAPAPAPVQLPPAPLFGGAGFSKPAAPSQPSFKIPPAPSAMELPRAPERKVEATAVSALLPAPEDANEPVTQLEVAAATALADDIPEITTSQITDASAVAAALSSTSLELPDLPLLGDRASESSPKGSTALADVPVMDPTPSMLMDVPVMDPTPSMMVEPVMDPTPSMMVDVPAESGAAQPLLDAPVMDPTPSMMVDVPAEPRAALPLLDVPVMDPTPSMMVDVPAEPGAAQPLLDVPVMDPTPSMMVDVPALLDVPAEAKPAPSLLDVPVLDPTPSTLLDVPAELVPDGPVGDAPLSAVLDVQAEPQVVLEASVMAPTPLALAAVPAEPQPMQETRPTPSVGPGALAEPAFLAVAAEPTPFGAETEPPLMDVAIDVEPQAGPVVDLASGAQPGSATEGTRPVVQSVEVVPPPPPSVDKGPTIVVQAAPEPLPLVDASPLVADLAAPHAAAFDQAEPAPIVAEASPSHVVPAASLADQPPAESGNWSAVVDAVRGAEPTVVEELPVLEVDATVDAPVVPSSSSSAFDALAIPPPEPSRPGARPAPVSSFAAPIALSTPVAAAAHDQWEDVPTSPEFPAIAAPPQSDQVFASSWEEPAAAPAHAPATEVFASSWDADPAAAPAEAPATEVFASSWEEPAAAPAQAPATEVFASSWEEPAAAPAEAPATEVFASSWEAPAAELGGQPDDRVELASNADFIPGAPVAGDVSIDVADVGVDTEAFEVQSGPAASLANAVADSNASTVEGDRLELASNSDFLDAAALNTTGESWERTGPSIDLEEPEPEGDIIQGIVVEEEPTPVAADAGWGAEIPVAPAPPPLNTRVAVPVAAPAPVARPAPVMPTLSAPGPVAMPPAPQRVAPAPVIAAAPSQPVSPAPVVQPPARVMADQLFDRSATVRGPGGVVVRGDHRVILHTMEGQVKRGALKDPDLGADSLSLEGPAGGVEAIALGRVKAIFFMLAPGARSPAGEGQKVRVTFKDGRQVAGFSRDHGQGGPGFFVVPADNRTNTERIYIYRHGIQAVSVE